MLSDEQQMEKKKSVEKVVTQFLKSKKTIKEISAETGIPTSSVQRYLNDESYIREIFGSRANLIIEEIHRKLDQNKLEGHVLGGQTYAQNYEATRGYSGLFTGSKRR